MFTLKTDILSSKNKLLSNMKFQKYSNLRRELIQDITDVSLYTNKPVGLLMGVVIVQIIVHRGVTKLNVSAGFPLHSMRNNPSKCNRHVSLPCFLIS